jgi:hypothetical protein
MERENTERFTDLGKLNLVTVVLFRLNKIIAIAPVTSKTMLDLEVVKSDSKEIISLSYSKSVTQSALARINSRWP